MKSSVFPYHMDDQDVSQDARKDQEPKQNSIYSENLRHVTILSMATWFGFPLCQTWVFVYVCQGPY